MKRLADDLQDGIDGLDERLDKLIFQVRVLEGVVIMLMKLSGFDGEVRPLFEKAEREMKRIRAEVRGEPVSRGHDNGA